MRVSIRHGAVVKCDVPNCKESYTTYSIVTLARTQAGGAGWGRLKLGTMPDWENYGLGSSKRKQIDVCPPHIPRPAMEGARP